MKFSMFFCKEMLNKNHSPAVSPNPTNTYIIHLQEKHKLPPKNSPAAIKTARLDIRKDTEVPAPFVSQYRRSLDSFLQGVFDIGIDS